MNSLGKKLMSARKMAGYSLQRLADEMDIEITKQALNLYELGKSVPSEKVLDSIVKALNIDLNDISIESKIRNERIEFRVAEPLSAKELDSIKYNAVDYLEKYCEVENLLNIKSNFENPFLNNKIDDSTNVDELAEKLRKIWSLGTEPINDVISLLEDRGIKIYETYQDASRFSGMSLSSNSFACIILNKNREMDIVRRRLTALHELAHLMFPYSSFPDSWKDKQIENFCFAFGRAVLLPKKNFIKQFGEKRKSIVLGELIALENQYGISVKALMMRAAYDLNIITGLKLNEFFKWINNLADPNKMLGDFQAAEKPVRFQRLIYRALSESIITPEKAKSYGIIDHEVLKKYSERVI